MDELSEQDKIDVSRARKIEISQPFFVVTLQFTGLDGKYVAIQDTVKSFDEILSVNLIISEQAFYLVGSIDEAKEKGAKLDNARFV